MHPLVRAELLDGRPHGDEGELLQHLEAEVEGSVSQLRQLKQANEEAQASISELVAEVAASHDAFERQRLAVAGELSRLQHDVAQHEAGMRAKQESMPSLPEGEFGAAFGMGERHGHVGMLHAQCCPWYIEPAPLIEPIRK